MTGDGQLYYSETDSPIGPLLVLGDGTALRSVYMQDQKYRPPPGANWRRDEGMAVLRAACAQLGAYFAGELRVFDLPLAMDGTEFQVRVWRALQEIPYGRTESYGALAARLCNPGGARAVGLANGRNPFAIVVPCHRVVGANGTLTGYGGGLDRKRWLLDHERADATLTLF